MAIETICQSCNKTLRVADEHAGKQARCPACGTIYTVPSAYAAKAPTASTPTHLRNPFDDLTSAPAPSPSLAGSSSDPPSWSSRSFANPPAKETAVERWYMKIDDGREFGPVERRTLDQWYAERRIGATTQLKREFDANWQPARNVYAALGSATQNPPANPFADQPQQYGYAMPTPGGYGSRTFAEPHRGGLILTLALVSWLVPGCFFLGAVAWIMGASDLKKIREGVMDPSGQGMTQAGTIIGAIATVLALIGIAFFFLAIMVAALGK
jgi:hypothetical protein